jgi:Fusaric acid resistance protein-like
VIPQVAGTRGSRRLHELEAAAGPIAQTAVAAGVSWWIATDVLHHTTPLFAPISAIIALGLNAGYRTRRALEMIVGVSLGVLIGDALIDAIGTGPVQMGLAVLLAMTAAVLLGGGALLASQAATSSVLVTALLPSSYGLPPPRLIDTLVGGGVGLLVLAAAPGNPTRLARRTGEPLMGELAGALEAIAAALEEHDRAGAETALLRLRAIERPAEQFVDDLGRLRETVVIAPTNWYRRGAVDRLAAAAPHIDHAIRNARVLARAARRAIDLEPALPPGLPGSVRLLAEASRTLFAQLLADAPAARETGLLLDAAGLATHALDAGASLSTGALAGQVRSIALDLLVASGVPADEAVRSVRRAGEAPTPD